MTTDAELLADAEGVLRAVEWNERLNFGDCPCCDAAKHKGHAPGCELYRVLGRLAGRREGRGVEGGDA